MLKIGATFVSVEEQQSPIYMKRLEVIVLF